MRGNLETEKPPYMSFPGVSLVDAVALGAHIPESARRESEFSGKIIKIIRNYNL